MPLSGCPVGSGCAFGWLPCWGIGWRSGYAVNCGVVCAIGWRFLVGCLVARLAPLAGSVAMPSTVVLAGVLSRQMAARGLCLWLASRCPVSMPSAGKPFCLAVLLAGVQVLPWLAGGLGFACCFWLCLWLVKGVRCPPPSGQASTKVRSSRPRSDAYFCMTDMSCPAAFEI